MSPRPYLLAVAETLWPDGPAPEVHRGRPAHAAGHTFLAVPDARSPRLLLPSGRAAAATALRAYGGQASRSSRLRTRAASGVLSLGLGGLLFRDRVSVRGDDGGISEELGRVLGMPVQVAVRGGPPRANRKPVLAVLGPDGDLVAFAKLGDTPLTAALVRAEGDALTTLGRLTAGGIRVPRLIHRGSWRGMPLLVQEALPLRRSRPVGRPALLRAMKDVADVLGAETATWGSSPHAGRVRERLARVPESPVAAELGRAVDVVAACPTELTLAAWHGDWTAWNCASVAGTVLVWDWERFSGGVPLGFDVLHHELQSAMTRAGVPSSDLSREICAAAPRLLAPFGLAAAQARLTAVAYLLEVASRYLADDQAGAGASRVGGIDSWLLPVITRATADLPALGEESN